MFTPSSDHFRHHARFYASAAVGVCVWMLLAPGWLTAATRYVFGIGSLVFAASPGK